MGNHLFEEQKNLSIETAHAKRDAETWGTKTRDLIAAAYGDGEAALFADSSGYVFYGDGSERSMIRNWIDGRLRRISELLRRTDSERVNDNETSGLII